MPILTSSLCSETPSLTSLNLISSLCNKAIKIWLPQPIPTNFLLAQLLLQIKPLRTLGASNLPALNQLLKHLSSILWLLLPQIKAQVGWTRVKIKISKALGLISLGIIIIIIIKINSKLLNKSQCSVDSRQTQTRPRLQSSVANSIRPKIQLQTSVFKISLLWTKLNSSPHFSQISPLKICSVKLSRLSLLFKCSHPLAWTIKARIRSLSNLPLKDLAILQWVDSLSQARICLELLLSLLQIIWAIWGQ